MKAADRPILQRYVAAFKKRGLTATAAFVRGKEAFLLASSGLNAIVAGRQGKSKVWRTQLAEGHRRVISRIGEIGRTNKRKGRGL